MHAGLPVLVASLVLALLPSGAAGQELGGAAAAIEAGRPDRAEVAERLRQASDAAAGGSSQEANALEAAYREALEALDAALAHDAQAQQWTAEASGFQGTIAELQSEIADETSPSFAAVEGLEPAALEALRLEAEVRLERARKSLEFLETRVVEEAERPGQIADRLIEVEVTRQGLEAELADVSGEASRIRMEARLAEQVSLAASLRVEEATYSARRDILSAQLRLAREAESARAAELRQVEVALNAAREQAARAEESAAEAAVVQAAMEGEAFAAEAARTLEVRKETLRFTRELGVDRARIQSLKAREEGLRDRLERTRRRIGIAGLSKDTGLHLRRERQSLIETRVTRGDAALDDERRIEIELALFESETQLNDAIDDATAVPWLVQAAAIEGRNGEEVAQIAQRLHDDYVDALDARVRVLQDRSQQLLELTSLRKATLASQKAYEAFVAERILWIRSSEPLWRLGTDDFAAQMDGVVWPHSFGEMVEHARGEVARRPLVMALIALGLTLLLAARLRVRKALADEGELARLRSQVSIAPTLRATILSFLIALPYAAVLYVVSWLASTTTVDTAFTRALDTACLRAAGAALIIGALRALTATNGLEEAHFEADPEAVKLVRRQTNWLLPIMPTAALAGEFLSSLDAGSAANTLARVAFLVEVGSLLVFTWRVLSPKRGVLALNVRAAGADDWMTRLRRFWFIVAVATLSLLGLLAIVGYGFTARSLFGRFELTVGLVLALVTLRSIALRWIKLIRRREALEKLRKKREEQRAKRLAEIERRRNAGEDVEELESQGLKVEEEEVNLATISSDLKRLIRVVTVAAAIGGAYLIWSSVLPALGAFERVELWQREATAKGVDGVLTKTVESVTLASLGLALVILIATWRVVKDLPALVEIILLQRLELGSGERYAVTTLLRYFLTTVGLLLAFDELGLAWSQLQWLVAGVSVGLGFGLQEIFANFVSGLTLLFERPVRVGDWVTLGDIEGVVSKIRIRATTIRDRDLKELIVPNREFITGRFINWTLSDPVSRVKVAVGIAYGSDTERAIQLLLDAGRDCPFSVEEPAPSVVFTSFGASSLDFELLVFVHGREIKPRVVNDLHLRIDAAFRAADIEISFPQRDLHIRSAPGLSSLAPSEPSGSGETSH